MSAAVLLDTGPLGVITNPNMTPAVRAANRWLAGLQAAGRRVIIPEISDYELRRKLLHRQSVPALARLDWWNSQLEYLPLTTSVMRRAADLWATARRQGRPTAPDPALDGDVILAAQALTLGGPVVIATGNPAHVSRFAPAELWSNIAP